MLSKIFRPKLITALFVIVASMFMMQPVLALSPAASSACGGLVGIDSNAAANCNNPSSTGSTLGNLANTVVNILSIIIGVVAVIMILVAGIRFITSGGGEGVKSAKNTLVYALIGLAVAVLAQVMIHFVIFRAAKPAANPTTGNLVNLLIDHAS